MRGFDDSFLFAKINRFQGAFEIAFFSCFNFNENPLIVCADDEVDFEFMVTPVPSDQRVTQGFEMRGC